MPPVRRRHARARHGDDRQLDAEEIEVLHDALDIERGRELDRAA